MPPGSNANSWHYFQVRQVSYTLHICTDYGFCSFMDILKENIGPQMNYQVSVCLWLLSFEQNIAEHLNKSGLSFRFFDFWY